MFYHNYKNNQKGITRTAVILGIFIILAILFLFGSIAQNRTNQTGTSEEFTEINGLAVLYNSEELFKVLDNSFVVDALRKDITYFANNTLDSDYLNKISGIFFETNTVQVRDENIFIEGRFDQLDEKILITVGPLPQDRIKVSILNETTNANIDSLLPSNSTRNQFISTLPLQTQDYQIDYLKLTDSFTITMYNDSPEAVQAAKTKLFDEAGFMLDSEYSIVYPAWLGNGISD